jgi:hypothetical protein
MANTKKPVNITYQSISEVPENVDPHMLIPVRSGFHGLLTYVNPRTKEETYWRSFGDIQDLELTDLRGVKSTCKKFYERNYFLFDDEYSWVIKYLGVEKYYDHALSVKGFDELFTKTPSEIKEILARMPEGQKMSMVNGVKDKVASGEIDSFKIIKALEEGLHVNLTEQD